MLKDYLDFVGRKYRNENTGEGNDLGGAAAEGAAAEGAATESADTILTGDAEKDSEAGADASADDTAAGKDGDSDAGEEGADSTPPDTYADFELPEGMELDVAAMELAIPVFKDLGLTQEQAQKLTDVYAAQVQAGSQKQIDDFNQLMTDWQTQTKNDSEIGGDKFDENVKVAQAAINKYGTPELKQLLEQQGVGNHPEVVRFMVRVGNTLKEDVPGGTSGAIAQAQDRVTRMYGKQSET